MKIFGAFISILIAQSAGIIGSVFTASSIPNWYQTIDKPIFNPPSWLFAPVWTVLYALMGIASYIVWLQRDIAGAKTALVFYGIQLFLNALWSILFFGFKNPALAFVEIIVLLITIIITTVLFWKINPWAGGLMIPYILWVSFATFLNFSIWQLN